MRHSRTLTANERLEMGLFLFMLLMGFLCIAAIMKANGFSFAASSSSLPPAAAAVDASANGTSESTPADFIDIVQEAPAKNAIASPAPATPPQAATSAKAVTPSKPAPEVAAPPKPHPDTRRYNGTTYRYVRTLRMRVTGYAPDARCCWPYDGTTTASGKSVKTNGGKLVAADTDVIPLHSLVIVPGYAGNNAVPVLDRGGAIKGHRLDVLLPTFDIAQNWGVKYVDVKIYEPVIK